MILRSLSLLLALAAPALADDWPHFRGDAARSGRTESPLSPTLVLRWTFKLRHAPEPAWPTENRMVFDRAPVPVTAGGSVFFGCSVTGKMYALDLSTGRIRWTFATEGPVRTAPAAWRDRVFGTSDDGFLYSLSAADGAVLWKKRLAPNDRKVFGNDRMVSLWPARGGPVVLDNTVYVGAGIWPSDGVYLYALDAETGAEKWVNDDSGSIYMPQPHGGANARSGVSAQGLLLARDDRLFVPTGRAVPAAFDRSTGKFAYFHLQENGRYGGAEACLVGPYLFNGESRMGAYDPATGRLVHRFKNRTRTSVAGHPGGFLLSDVRRLSANRWTEKEKADRKGKMVNITVPETLWTADVPGGISLIAAGGTAVVGAPGAISTVDLKTKKTAWTAKIEGAPYGLAASNGRLIVGTDRGFVYCFAPEAAESLTVEETAEPSPSSPAVAKAAAEIVRTTGVTEGICLDLACGDGALALELARRTKLRIIAIDADPENVEKARARLERAGLYGSRVDVHLGVPEKTPYPKYVANLIVSGRSTIAGPDASLSNEIGRLLRPYGGISCLGAPGAMKKTVRGPLENAGSWTHQYGTPGNTCSSGDRRVKGRLRMFWWRQVDIEMPQRHGRGPAPLFHEGRLFVEGLHALRAVDAYNGRTIWEYPLKDILKAYDQDHLVGTALTGSNFCVGGDSVYVRRGGACLRLDAATGKKIAEFKIPGDMPGSWGFIALMDGILFGSVADESYTVRHAYIKSKMDKLFGESHTFFALDARTGALLWSRKARNSFRHNTVAMGGGRLHLIDRPVAKSDRIDATGKEPHPGGEILTLDAKTGRVLWRKHDDVYGTVLVASPEHNVLLMCYQRTSFRMKSERGGRLAAFQASSGRPLWEQHAGYTLRPTVIDRTVYFQKGTFDLLTGARGRFLLGKSYGCGVVAASHNLMLYRSATMGYYDLNTMSGTRNYGGIRLGCWINALPVGGLVLVPDAATGCSCSYLMHASIALEGE